MPTPPAATLSNIVTAGKKLARELSKLDVTGDVKDVVNLASIALDVATRRLDALNRQGENQNASDVAARSDMDNLLHNAMDWISAPDSNPAPEREPTPCFPPELNTLSGIVSKAVSSPEKAEMSGVYIQYMSEVRGFTGPHGTVMLLQRGNADVERLAQGVYEAHQAVQTHLDGSLIYTAYLKRYLEDVALSGSLFTELEQRFQTTQIANSRKSPVPTATRDAPIPKASMIQASPFEVSFESEVDIQTPLPEVPDVEKTMNAPSKTL
ncbi:hypothetical protein FRB90_000231 [Tulasnella sp. 427]|nr:hypothetical protein FRB90_000231 [Tulasnella sp. 427]